MEEEMSEIRGLILFIIGYIIGKLIFKYQNIKRGRNKMSVIEVLVLTAVGALIGNIVGEILANSYLKYIKRKKKKQ